MRFSPGSQVHFVGIAGSGMSGIASIMLDRGFAVSGSDSKDQATLEPLRKKGARIFIGHDASQIEGAATLVLSSAIDPSNPEVVEARRRGIPILIRAEALAELLVGRRSVAVAGTHGKTTTSAMLSWALRELGSDPSFVIGSQIMTLDISAHHGSGENFIVEADESDGSFTHYRPEGAIVTNLELDHVDNFKDLDAVRATFEDFLKSVGNYLVLCGDDDGVATLPIPASLEKITYGFNDESFDLHLSEASLTGESSSAKLTWRGRAIGVLRLSIAGRHNLLNAAATVATLIKLGHDPHSAISSLENFHGTSRRFERKGMARGVLVIDDYGHHPTEIRATLVAARRLLEEREGGRLIAIFQPHRYSRTMAFLDEFADSLSAADFTYLLDIYAASEKPIPGVSSKDIVARISPGRAKYQPDQELLFSELKETLREGDLVITLGAGDVTKVGPQLLSALVDRS